MSDEVTLQECLAELPPVAYRASGAVLELYLAIRQARVCGATYDQLVAGSGLSRGNVQRVVSGELPKFSVRDG